MNRRRFLAASAVAPALITGSCTRDQTVSGRIVGGGHAIGHRLRTLGALPKPTHTIKADVVVVGGGVAGLAAARKLKQLGVEKVVVLELEEKAGGTSLSESNAINAYPWGAHYVPLPGKDCHEVLEFFGEIGLIKGHDAAGRPIYDEMSLCHDPQERLFIHGEWHEGISPTAGLDANGREQFKRFADEIEKWRVKQVFSLPVDRSRRDPEALELDTLTMAAWLNQKGFNAEALLWQVDYSCRDDFGGGIHEVSAWAGLHYFASRTGEAANAEHETVLTWEEGNGWLVGHLKAIDAEIRAQHLVMRMEAVESGGVEVDAFDCEHEEMNRFQARAAICALPRFVAQRIIPGLTPIPGLEYAPWVVANLTLDELPPSPGFHPAWDNVVYRGPSLGYVNANHQTLRSRPIETVITHYEALCEAPPAKSREWMLTQTHAQWTERVLGAFSAPHPDLREHVQQMDIWLWGHGMIRPRPGFLWGKERELMQAHRPPIFFAHTDMSGMALFEEAYTRGVQAALALKAAL
ncbi:FAD-dependent oxidoreductase [Brevifollis gellanilyticus]|uniref:Amino oxidase n=1 Tax=Brevifollis gellanilyticus TaxID=748831 RepID=A0A512M4L5_9BACT|nr:FAD-dependent oxidoreductase [Brevifollis gellanilyticus]GEP41684.1 amino oxidase [Brevifollis gellanilyticus]